MGRCSFVYILSVENCFSKLKVSEGNVRGIGMHFWGQIFASDQRWGPVSSSLPG